MRFLPDHTGTIHLLFCLIFSTEKVTDSCNSNLSRKKKMQELLLGALECILLILKGSFFFFVLSVESNEFRVWE